MIYLAAAMFVFFCISTWMNLKLMKEIQNGWQKEGDLRFKQENLIRTMAMYCGIPVKSDLLEGGIQDLQSILSSGKGFLHGHICIIADDKEEIIDRIDLSEALHTLSIPQDENDWRWFDHDEA